ncbi:tRNA endonuclease ANKZF1 isoform X6 [Chrysemys picta bellii]|uniref:tRNA endonuclease ANKZF1 isoform X6 n=1 Tax=Chrysemys picta bellii TaxID=8478 RepID=UPI0032B1FA1D
MQPLEVRSVFEAAQDPTFLHGLSLVNGFSEDVPSTDSNAIAQEKPVAGDGEERACGVPEISDRMCCSSCSREFDSREEQTEHYRLDWHRFNLKQRLLGRRALAAEEFEEKTRAGDVSSISGSDSDYSDSGSESDLLSPRGHGDPGSDQQSHRPGTRSAKVLFHNSQGQLLSAYRCVLGSKKGGGEQQAELVASLQSLGAGTCWVILMIGGGHFAGAVFRGPEVLDHKTFHRYTVRARRGTAQGLRDAQGQASMPKSAGASLRRYNEAALLKDIQDLLAGWAQHLQGAQRIFLRAPRANRALLFSSKNAPLHKDDPRVCNIPFSTRRATFREVLRVHAALATLQVYGKDTAVADLAGSPRKGWRKVPCARVEEPQQSDASTPSQEEEEEESQAGELETVEVTLSTLQLREFEVTPKRSRKRRRKKDKVGRGAGARAEGPGGQEEPEGSAPQPGAETVADPQEGPGAEPAPWGKGGARAPDGGDGGQAAGEAAGAESAAEAAGAGAEGAAAAAGAGAGGEAALCGPARPREEGPRCRAETGCPAAGQGRGSRQPQALLAVRGVPAGPDPLPLPRLLLLLHGLPADPPPGPRRPHLAPAPGRPSQGAATCGNRQSPAGGEGEVLGTPRGLSLSPSLLPSPGGRPLPRPPPRGEGAHGTGWVGWGDEHPPLGGSISTTRGRALGGGRGSRLQLGAAWLVDRWRRDQAALPCAVRTA